MVGNSSFVKMEKSRKQARNAGKQPQEKPQYAGKTWKRTDKRMQQPESE